jgi:ABC-type sugar transport system ATPase subunit
MPDDAVLLRVTHVSKRFGVTRALDDVSVSFRVGEVHALMGENGAGKSTLGKVIAGLHKPDTGLVEIVEGDGFRTLRPGSIDDAFNAGVRIVHQELAQCPNLSVAENLNLHHIPRTSLGLVDRRTMNERAARLVHRLDPSIDVAAPLGSLAPGRRQICQIAASLGGHEEPTTGETPVPLSNGARVIVFDEPTSSLSITETQRLLEITRQLAAEGITIIYVSHRMGEIFACCDRVSVLRDGRYIATSVVAEIDEGELVEQMIGRRISGPQRRSANGSSAVTAAIREIAGDDARHVRSDAPSLLDVRSLSSPGKIRDVSLTVGAGEVVGIGGLVGAGRSEVLDAIFGLDKRATGTVLVDGRAMPLGHPRQMIRAGVGYVPEDRKLQGLFFDLGVDENIVVPAMPDLARGPLRDLGAERRLVDERVESFQIKTASTRDRPDSLSGGNQQKLLIARWMGHDARVLLLDEPTRGIDVGTKAEVYKLIRAAADRGCAVLFISSEMPELLALSDRILVLAEGELGGELTGDEMTQRNILTLATREHRATG